MPNCLNCGKEFEWRRYYPKKIYCSKKCRDAFYYKIDPIGRNKSSRLSKGWSEDRLMEPVRKRENKKILVPLLNQEVIYYKNNCGYPCCTYKGKKWLIHRLVMKFKLAAQGLELLPTDTVQHIDKDRMNFHPDNLQLIPGRHGCGAGVLDPLPHYEARFREQPYRFTPMMIGLLNEFGYDVTRRAA